MLSRPRNYTFSMQNNQCAEYTTLLTRQPKKHFLSKIKNQKKLMTGSLDFFPKNTFSTSFTQNLLSGEPGKLNKKENKSDITLPKHLENHLNGSKKTFTVFQKNNKLSTSSTRLGKNSDKTSRRNLLKSLSHNHHRHHSTEKPSPNKGFVCFENFKIRMN